MPQLPTCSLPEILRDGSDADLRTYLYDLFSVSRMLDFIRETMGARLGISGFQFHLLMAVNDLGPEDPPGIKRLAAHLRVAAPNVTVEVNKLVDMGLLEKRRDEKDGRAVNIHLTRRAVRAVDAVLPFVRDVNDRMFAGLDRDSFQAARRAMLLLSRNGEQVLDTLRRADLETA